MRVLEWQARVRNESEGRARLKWRKVPCEQQLDMGEPTLRDRRAPLNAAASVGPTVERESG